MSDFSERLNTLIRQSHLSRKEIAKQCRISLASLSRYLSGERFPRAETVNALAKILGTTADELLTPVSDDTFELEYRRVLSFLRRTAGQLSDRQKREIILLVLADQNNS